MTDILDSRTSWVRLMITVAAGVVGNAGMWTLIVVMPMMERDFALSRADTSLIFVVTMLGFALGNLVTGRMTDRLGVVPTLITAAAMVGLGHLAVGLTGNVWLVALAQFIVGLGTAGSFAPLMADISHWFQRRRGIAVSIAASSNYLAGVVWPLLMRGWIEAWGWQNSYLLMGVLVLVLVPPLTLLLRARVPDHVKAAANAAAAGRAGSLGLSGGALTVLLSLAGVACCVAMAMPQVHIVAYCVDLGFGAATGAEMLSLMLMGGVASRLIGGMISDRFGGMPTLLLFGAMQALALFLYIPFDGLVSLYIVSLIFGLSQGGIVPAYAVIVREYMPAHVAGSRVGVVMMATILGMAIGGWMSGWIYDQTHSYLLAFVNGILWNMINVGIVLWLLLRGKRLQSRPRGGTSAATV